MPTRLFCAGSKSKVNPVRISRMWPFRRRRSKILDTCNFAVARDELGDFFRAANQHAKADDKVVIFKKHFAEGWERFAANPCRETASRWLKDAPDYDDLILGYFEQCCPGGYLLEIRLKLERHLRS